MSINKSLFVKRFSIPHYRLSQGASSEHKVKNSHSRPEHIIRYWVTLLIWSGDERFMPSKYKEIVPLDNDEFLTMYRARNDSKSTGSIGGLIGGLASDYGKSDGRHPCEPYTLSLESFEKMSLDGAQMENFADFRVHEIELDGDCKHAPGALFLNNPRITKSKSVGTFTKSENALNTWLDENWDGPKPCNTVYCLNLELMEYQGMKDCYWSRLDWWILLLVKGHSRRAKMIPYLKLVMLCSGQPRLTLPSHHALCNSMTAPPPAFDIPFYMCILKEMQLERPYIEGDELIALSFTGDAFGTHPANWIEKDGSLELERVSVDKCDESMLKVEKIIRSRARCFKAHWPSGYDEFKIFCRKFCFQINLDFSLH